VKKIPMKDRFCTHEWVIDNDGMVTESEDCWGEVTNLDDLKAIRDALTELIGKKEDEMELNV
jgi:hypothetical protein